MKKKILIFTIATAMGWVPISSVAQTSNFKIGIYDGYHRTNIGAVLNTNKYASPGIYSSVLGVCGEDGFNLLDNWSGVFTGEPFSFNYSRSLAKLATNNGFQIMDELQFWYKPSFNPSIPGSYSEAASYNQYTVNQNGTATPNNSISAPVYYNYDNLYDSVYNVAPYNQAFFAHKLGGEMSYFHGKVSPNRVPNNWSPDSYWSTASGHVMVDPWLMTEIPPGKLSDATIHFNAKENALSANQFTAIAPAKHSEWLGSGNVGLPNFHQPPYNGHYIEEDYLDATKTPTRADLIVEASYFTTNFNGWNTNPAYLGKFRSLDYIKSKGFTNILSELCITNDDPAFCPYYFNSNPDIKNGNMLKTQAYGSIIHGAKGVVFYCLDLAFDPSSPTELANLNILRSNALIGNGSDPNPYTRNHFPVAYNTYIAPLTRELKYLVSNNFISSNNNVLYQKGASADVNGILPASTSYVPATILAADIRDYNKINNINPSTNFTGNTNRDEEHGLHYIITTNGTESVMIVSNPHPYSVHNVPFNFAGIGNTQISNAKFVDVLFDDGNITNVNDVNYKTNLDNVAPGTFNLLRKYTFPFCNKTFTADFGPFDVKIYNFKTSVVSGPDYANGWSKEWTNNASGLISTWGTINATDKFIPFDADGDGDEELLCVQALNSAPPGVAAKAKILDYNGTTKTWSQYWSNNDNGSFNKITYSGWGVRALDKYIVGDFDGDGKNNELLCIQGDGGYATILKFNVSTNNFDGYWSNYGNNDLNTTSSVWYIQPQDKFLVGDFNNDGKNNELMCVSNGCWELLNFNTASSPKNFTMVAVSCTSKISSGSTTLWNIGSGDEFRAGDFDGDGKIQEVLCTERPTGYTSAIIKYSGAWSTIWSNAGNGNIGGWGIPLLTTDKVLAGNLDADSKDEFMFIQRCNGCGYAASENLNASNQPEWHWSNHNYTGSQVNYINDWQVNDKAATNADYLLIKPVVGGTKYLLARKNYACGNFLVSLYKPQTGLNFRTTTDEKGTTGIKAVTEQDTGFNLYPNPNAGSFTVSFLNNDHRKISIYNALGAVVYEKETNEETMTIDLDTKDKGVYIMRVIEQDQTKVKRIIIQ